jgi:ABC-type nitrate/sulfonate/bicarbonate transport system permease component
VTAERARRAVDRVNVPGWLFVIGLTVVAELAIRRLGLEDSVARPSETFHALRDGLSSGELSGEARTTLERYVQGFALAIVCGVALGVLIGSSRILGDATFVVLEFLRPIPAVVFIVVAPLFLGNGTPMIRFVVAYAAVWPVLLNTLYGVRGTDRMLHDVARTSGVGRAGRLVRVTLPAAAPSIATGIRVSAPIALLVCVTAEFLTLSGGIGSTMRQQQDAFQLPEMYAAIVLTALLGYGINLALRATERRTVFWVGEERAAWR